MAPLNVLVLGGGGYLGGRLIERFRANAKTRWTIAEHSQAGQPHDDNDSVYLDWLAQEADRPAILKRGPFDAVLHLAFPDRNVVSSTNLEEIVASVEDGMQFLLSLSAELGARSFVHISTAKVYGVGLEGYVYETHERNPQDPYSVLHAKAEQQLAALAGHYQASLLSLRLANSFGRPVDTTSNRWDLIVNEMCAHAVDHCEITLGGGAYDLKDFVPMSYAVDTIVHHLEASLRAERAVSGKTSYSVRNLGTGHARSLYHMAQIVQQRAQIMNGHPVSIRLPETFSAHSKSIVQANEKHFLGYRNTTEPPVSAGALEEMTRAEVDSLLHMRLEMKGGN